MPRSLACAREQNALESVLYVLLCSQAAVESHIRIDQLRSCRIKDLALMITRAWTPTPLVMCARIEIRKRMEIDSYHSNSDHGGGTAKRYFVCGSLLVNVHLSVASMLDNFHAKRRNGVSLVKKTNLE